MTDQKQNDQQTEQPTARTKEQLAGLSLFLVGAITELAAGLQENTAAMQELLPDDQEGLAPLIDKELQILAGIAGVSSSIAVILGCDVQDLGKLSKEVTTKIMAQYDALQQQTH